jgi:hypothetical protein
VIIQTAVAVGISGSHHTREEAGGPVFVSRFRGRATRRPGTVLPSPFKADARTRTETDKSHRLRLPPHMLGHMYTCPEIEGRLMDCILFSLSFILSYFYLLGYRAILAYPQNRWNRKSDVLWLCTRKLHIIDHVKRPVSQIFFCGKPQIILGPASNSRSSKFSSLLQSQYTFGGRHISPSLSRSLAAVDANPLHPRHMSFPRHPIFDMDLHVPPLANSASEWPQSGPLTAPAPPS